MEYVIFSNSVGERIYYTYCSVSFWQHISQLLMLLKLILNSIKQSLTIYMQYYVDNLIIYRNTVMFLNGRQF